MNISFVALNTTLARDLQRGGKDVNGQTPQRATSDGGTVPCRHCLTPVGKGEDYLILAHRPFPEAQPFAETGPIFLHAKECSRAIASGKPAPMFQLGGSYILRGYSQNHWINHDAAEVVTPEKLTETGRRLLSRNDVAYVHMRSSKMNCYQCRIERV